MDFSTFPVWSLFVVTLTATVTSNLLNAYYVKRKLKSTTGIYFYTGCQAIMATISLYALGGFKFEISAFSALLGLVFGVVTLLGSFLNTYAYKIGPLGYTTVIVNFSTAVTALSGWAFFGEEISVFKIVGIVFILVCLTLTVDTSKNNGNSANKKWFFVCLIALVVSASIGLLQKVHQSSDYKNELTSFLITAFFVDSVFSFVMFAIRSKRANATLPEEEKITAKSICTRLFVIFILIIGICSALNNALNLYLSGVVDSAVFFPIVNGVPLMATLLFSFLFFKEKLTKKQTLGLISGLIAIAFLMI